MEKNKEKNKLRGFASIIAKQIEPLNDDEKFKEKFKDTEVKVLINAKDGKWAGLIVIDKGTIHVEGIKNTPKENIKKRTLDGKAYWKLKLRLFWSF